MHKHITEESSYFSSEMPTNYLCGVTFIWQLAKDYGNGEVLETASSYVPEFALNGFLQALLHDLFTYDEFPPYEEFEEEHSEELFYQVEQYGFPPIKYIIEQNRNCEAKLSLIFAFQLDETMRMRKVVLNG